jgi:hypothetical protein
MDFQNSPTWAPNGYIDPMDEYALQDAYAKRNQYLSNLYYAYNFPFDGRQIADETYGGNAFQYIPTEIEIGAAIAMRNMAEANELPIQTNDPGMSQLLQSIYQRTVSFWQNVRQASGTGW